jgi:hypothetical protein
MRVAASLPSAVLACVLVCLAAPGGSLAAVPPDRADPCAQAGRDSCGTTGVGFYATHRYGSRWFGDFRHVIPGQAHTFCIDLRFWYASPAYRYKPAPAGALHNKDGVPVPPERQARLAYAIWEYGRSTRPRQQAAAMLYVHGLMGDARPGEVNPAALGRPVATLYRRIARAAARLRGPYRFETRLPGTLTVGQQTTATIRVRSAEGNPLPYVRLTLAADGVDTTARQVRTNGAGLAAISFTPTAAAFGLRVTTEALASSRPRIFVPTSAAAAANGQRLAVPSSERVSTTVSGRAQPVVVNAASSELVRPGSPIFDRIRVEGLGDSTARVEVELYGPFGSRRKISCTGRARWRGGLTVAGAGEVRSPPVELTRAGFYTYRAHLVGTPAIPQASTDCAAGSTTSLAVPRILAGRGDAGARAAVPAGATRPARVRLPALGIDAPVVPTGIDLADGALGLPASIGRAGWWRDGAAPGSPTGAILIAGHVDSARAGAGAFFKLHRARAGELVRLASADGSTRAYRVASVRSYHKTALPTSIYSLRGPPRLVLVTCGGRFDPVGRHYEDNVVLTAVPVTA